jgi:hypothetical protein
MQQKFNPFRPGKVVSPGMFSGRYDEIQSMERGLFQTKHGNPQHFLIEGERGIGKTSLLLYMDWVAKGEIDGISNSKFNFMVLNLELREGMSADDIADTILESLKREIAGRERLKELCKSAWDFLKGFEVAGVAYNSKTADVSLVKLDEITNILVEVIEKSKEDLDGIVILIDEADRPSTDAKLGEFCKLLTERLSRRKCEKVSLVLAGLPSLTGKIRESHQSAPRVFQIISLETLEPKECVKVIELGLDLAEQANKFRTQITPEASKALANLAEGYPHFIQEFCFCAFERDTDNNIDIDDVMAGAFSDNGALEQLGQKYYAGMYIDQIGSDDYRKVLLCMAESLDGWVERQHLIDKSGVKPTIIDNALKSLKEKRTIVPNPKKQGQYRLPTKSFAIWIKIKSGNQEVAAKSY